MNDAAPPPSGPPSGPPGDGGAPPSPYEAIRPLSRANDHQGERVAPRQGFFARMVSNAPLKLLAVLIAVLLWGAVRGRILVEDASIVRVQFVAPERTIRIEDGPDRGAVEVGLKGSRAEVERLQVDLDATTEPARFLFSVPAGATSGRVGPVSKGAQLQFPVPGATTVVRDLKKELEATWHRVVEVKLKLLPPDVPAVPDYPNIEFEAAQMEDAEVTVVGPVSLLTGERPVTTIRPDPVDLRAWLATDPDPYTPYQFEARFEAWRKGGRLRGTDLLEIRPEKVKGKIPLKPRRTETVTNFVRELWESADLMREWELTIRASTSFDPAARQLKAELRGDPKVLEQLKKTTRDWAYAIAVPAPPKPGEPPKENEVAEVFLWFRASPAPAVRLANLTTVFVSLKKRGG